MVTTESDDPRTDEELIGAAQTGDVDAFEVLYRRYRDWVMRLALRRTRTQDEALDVLQDTFEYVLRKLPDLELRAQFSSFLYPVVCNLARMVGRRRRRSMKALDFDPPAQASEEPGADLADALGGLPAHQRDVVLLRFVDGRSLQEIAELLAVPLGTVKSRLHKALAALREDPRTRRYFQEE